MGVGKTTVGAILAERLNINLVDTDQLIEQKTNKSIAQLFADHGEEYFRSLEQTTIREVLTLEPSVIATGGGLPCTAGAMEHIIDRSDAVWLMLGVDKIVERLIASSGRPLVQGLDMRALREQTAERLKSRRRYYQMADIHVQAWHSPARIADRILKKRKR